MAMKVETVIVGAGQAGLAMSYQLTQLRREHIVLEQAARPAHVWSDERWDSFTFVVPNWSIQLPGAEYRGDNPDGFMARNDIVAYFEQYARGFALPVQYNARVTAVEPDGNGYRVTTDQATYTATNVVVAIGGLQKSRVPPLSRDLPSSVAQLTSSQYRNPQSLPAGAVLVVGSAQSGCQIAEELYQSGRTVYLAVGSAGRVPRRYRGKDINWWMNESGYLTRPFDQMLSAGGRPMTAPHLSGTKGGHTINLHQFARDGVTLLGHLQGVDEGRIIFAPDLQENLTKADRFEAEIVKNVDGFIQRSGIDAPEEALPMLRDGFEAKIIRELNPASEGITTLIWAVGYGGSFDLVKLPLRDGDGFPVQRQVIANYPGLYFLGLPWLSNLRSALLLGVGEDAQKVAAHIVERR